MKEVDRLARELVAGLSAIHSQSHGHERCKKYNYICKTSSLEKRLVLVTSYSSQLQKLSKKRIYVSGMSRKVSNCWQQKFQSTNITCKISDFLCFTSFVPPGSSSFPLAFTSTGNIRCTNWYSRRL